MDLNLMFRRSLRLDWLDEIPVLPEHLQEIIIWKHLSSQPIQRFLELRSVCKRFQAFLTVSKLLKVHPIDESWELKQRVLKHTCVRRDNNTVALDTYDVLNGKRQLIPITSEVPLYRYRPPGLVSTDELRVSSSHGGENGLIYLEKDGASTCNAKSWRTTRECFVLNPMTESFRRLSLHCSVRQIDRFSSGYLSWASLGGAEMYPSLFDPLTETWNRIGFGFVTRGLIREEKAVANEVVYLRYQERRRDLKDLVIMYDMRQETFQEVPTTGLPNNMVKEHLFHHEDRIYLAAVLFFPATGRSMAEKDVLLYELKCTNTQWNWDTVSEIPSDLLNELTHTSPDLSELQFFYLDHELLVASLLSGRKTDGARVFLDKARPSFQCPKCYPCHAIVTYDLTSSSWRKDRRSRLGPKLDVHTTIFRPRLDIEA